MPQLTAQLLSPTGEVLASEVALTLHTHPGPSGMPTWHGTLMLTPTPQLIPSVKLLSVPYLLRTSNGWTGSIAVQGGWCGVDGEWHLHFRGVGVLTKEESPPCPR